LAHSRFDLIEQDVGFRWSSGSAIDALLPGKPRAVELETRKDFQRGATRMILRALPPMQNYLTWLRHTDKIAVPRYRYVHSKPASHRSGMCLPDWSGGLLMSSLFCLFLGLLAGGAAGFLFCAMLTVGQQSDALRGEPLSRPDA
jgi:hypothetical protein